MRRRRALSPAWMLEATGEASVARRRPPPPVRRRILPARGAEARIDALAKLKMLFDSGVLTARQFADERDRLLGS
ncbi:MAG: hypothetical protein JST08_19910 [Actinobacteria bacterium]|nr:hypothetical protein [Actinomycetota bacterium]